MRAQGKMLEVKSSTGKLLFSADDQEVVVGAERLRVTGELMDQTLHHTQQSTSSLLNNSLKLDWTQTVQVFRS